MGGGTVGGTDGVVSTTGRRAPGAGRRLRRRPHHGPRRPAPATRTLAAVVGVVAATAAVRLLVVTPVAVAGSSMEPTVHDGDVVVVSRLVRDVAQLRRGDLVVFRGPDGELVLKRVVGLPGEGVAVLDGRLTVDGTPVDEPYVDPDRVDGLYLGRVVVLPGTVFVLGDDRATSVDSRHHGPVDDDAVLGTVLLRLPG